jgi:hypothetical protein
VTDIMRQSDRETELTSDRVNERKN